VWGGSWRDMVANIIAKRFTAPSADNATQEPAAPTADAVQRFLQAQQIMSDAINQHLGFRGYMMMMRLQRTANLRDVHDLLPEFAQALVKRIGMDPATPIVDEVEQLVRGH